MVVDDQAEIRSCVADVTRMVAKKISSTATVLEASSAEEALDLIHLRKYQLDLLLSDMDMPGKNGLELAAAMKVPTIILTGSPLPEGTKKPANVTTELLKPVTSKELLSAIKSALAAKQH
ncbi:MAG TPA: response regulator [Candidatus Paceibacterota bacterium]|nr:response regulator [Candidatus Paceibacterota bacterium]